MAQTTPTLFSDAAYNTVLSNKNEPQNNLAQIATISVPATTAQNAVIAMIPFETGRLNHLDGFALPVHRSNSFSHMYEVGISPFRKVPARVTTLSSSLAVIFPSLIWFQASVGSPPFFC